MMRVTGRDRAMLEWLGTVRLADLEAVRWALSGFGERDREVPVSRRKAQQWASRMIQAGLVQRGRPNYHGGAIIWPTHLGSVRPPDLFRQTTRHEVTVARVAARYLGRGYTWSRDRRTVTLRDHQADGVAVRGGLVDLVEVELSPKTPTRYRGIHHNHAERLTSGGISRVVYLCTPEAARVVIREADTHLFRDLRPRLVAVPVFDAQGVWTGPDDAPWVEHLTVPAPTGLSAPGLWESIA